MKADSMVAPPKSEADVPVFLRALLDVAIATANPANCVPTHLPVPPKGRTLLIAAGKAAASMARAAEQAWPEESPLSGIALTRYGHAMPCDRIEVIEAAHPVPDDRGHEAAQRLMREASNLGADDLLLFLVSGGGSALLALPADGISIDEKKAINKSLLMSGAPIGEMNVVRKHLSAIKGGRLAQSAAPAGVVTLAISDVPGDDPSTIASGPTVPDPSTTQDALDILAKYNLKIPVSAANHFASGNAETPKPEDPVFANTSFHMVSTPTNMIEQVATNVKDSGINVTTLGANIEGEAMSVGAAHARMAKDLIPDRYPHLIISGGETTVTVANNAQAGKGGRNCEYLLSLAVELNGAPGIHALAADTDGIDGSEDNAGAIVTPDTLQRARALDIDPQAMLDGHDSYTFFEKLGDLIVTGPTRTNVNDFRAIWIS